MENLNLLHESCEIFNGSLVDHHDFWIQRETEIRSSVKWPDIILVENGKYSYQLEMEMDQHLSGFILIYDDEHHKPISHQHFELEPGNSNLNINPVGEFVVHSRNSMSMTISFQGPVKSMKIKKAQINLLHRIQNPDLDKKILVSSTQIPGHGGSATNGYYIVKYLRQMGFHAMGLFMDYRHNYGEEMDVDPDRLGGIEFIDRNLLEGKEKEAEMDRIKAMVAEYLGGPPDLCLAKNYVAPIHCKKIFPETYTVYLVSGINLFPMYLVHDNVSTRDVFNANLTKTYEIPRENICNDLSDLIVTNSRLSLELYRCLYPKYLHKIYYKHVDTTDCVRSDCDFEIPAEKDIDLAICCSNFKRKDKNNDFLINLLMNPRFDHCKKLVIGNNPEAFEMIPNTTCTGLLSNTETKKQLARAKILLYPSLFDANSNTVREAFVLQCLPLITINVGFYERFPNYLVCKTFNHQEWIFKIEFILKNYEYLIKETEIQFDDAEALLELIHNVDAFILKKPVES